MIEAHHIGYGLMGAGMAVTGASMVPEGTGVIPPGAPSAALMVGGVGMVGLGSIIAITDMK